MLEKIRPEKRRTFLGRNRHLVREIGKLSDQLELLRKGSNSWSIHEEAVFESAVIRTTKLVRNSGYTLRRYREFLRQSVIKPFRTQLYPLLDRLDEEEDMVGSSITKLKRFRDHFLVHMDPRFAFIDNTGDRRKEIMNDLEIVFRHIRNHTKLFTEELLHSDPS